MFFKYVWNINPSLWRFKAILFTTQISLPRRCSDIYCKYLCCWWQGEKKNLKRYARPRIYLFFPPENLPLLVLLRWKNREFGFGILSARLPPHILFPSTSPISYWWALQQFKLHVFFKHLTSKESNHTLCSNPASAEKCKCYCCEREIRKGYLEKFRLSVLIADWLCLTGMTRTREHENESTPHGGSFWSSALDRWQHRIAILILNSKLLSRICHAAYMYCSMSNNCIKQ